MASHPGTPDSQLARLLAEASNGAPDAVDELYAAVYGNLKTLAKRHLRREREDHTLGATALVHEAFLKLAEQHSVTWESQAHFYGIASQVMRRILVDHARYHAMHKRAREHQVTLDTNAALVSPGPSEEIVAVDEALAGLAQWDPRAAKLVELRYFGGMSIEHTAKVLGISSATPSRSVKAIPITHSLLAHLFCGDNGVGAGDRITPGHLNERGDRSDGVATHQLDACNRICKRACHRFHRIALPHRGHLVQEAELGLLESRAVIGVDEFG